jgi:aminoglycoside 6'-N-acetyltransferase I
MKIRAYVANDFEEWLRMRVLLWPELLLDGEEDAAADARDWLEREDACVFVAEREDGSGLCGFAEVGEREYADGCSTAPVAYVEGWYVDTDARRLGVGRDLVAASEVWAREQGYRELASDALIENVVSQKAHEASGFVEVERAVRYRKSLA